MPIYTASYFNTDHHHGRLVSISCSEPKGVIVHRKLDFLVPPADLHKDWENWKRSYQVKSQKQKFPAKKHIEEYQERYNLHIQNNWQALADYLNSYNPFEVETWQCWEREGEFCHRNLALAVVQESWPHLYGGSDVPMAIASPGLHYWFTKVLR
jgi:hypothetical protein